MIVIEKSTGNLFEILITSLMASDFDVSTSGKLAYGISAVTLLGAEPPEEILLMDDWGDKFEIVGLL